MKTWFIITVLVGLTFLLLALVGRRMALELIRERRVRIDRFKLRRKLGEIEREVFSSSRVIDAIVDHANENEVPVDRARAIAEAYLREIVPKFNLLAYYRFGAPLSRAILHFLYRVVVQRKTVRDFNRRAERRTVVVYLINHRSNADYVLVAHMLFKFISLSYAVGEWARVWPLNHLFKWFGAYFVRRNFRQPLYHAVLSSYVATITKRGVTQGVFLEGGLTRDGMFRKPKLGMLDYIVSSKRDDDFDSSLVFIPTAINYDRVLEDRTLTQELLGVEDRSTRFEKLRQTSGFLFKNFFRSVFRRFKRYGYAVVSFGDPISVDEFIENHPDIFAETWEERKPALRKLADTVMREISGSLPMTPVPVVAFVFRELGEGPTPEERILSEIGKFREATQDRTWHLRDSDPSRIWDSARRVLELRRLIEETEEGWRWNRADLMIRDFYANSLIPFDEAMKVRAESESLRTDAAPNRQTKTIRQKRTSPRPLRDESS
ncbi:MAG: 1-acyl-sn-glycerol-3-phosphate acyltransferase [Thermoanaerobaculia bacterium]|nr:1-acyl-sn-glycerol-3-phosphate acyltransferase [Thermoanaerobaculia bacterium]